MNFFSIKTSSEKRITGTAYPQIQTMGATVNKKVPDSLYNVYPDAFPNFTPNLNYFVLNENAKLTDVLSAAMISYGFILNEKIKNILCQYKLPPHEFYPAVVQYNDIFYKNYFWFFYICDIPDFIDYDRTKFFITDMVDNKIEDCENIGSANLLKSLKEVLPKDRNIDSDLIVFKKTLSVCFDLFKISFGNYRTYISELLHNTLMDNNISGFNISKTQRVIV